MSDLQAVRAFFAILLDHGLDRLSRLLLEAEIRVGFVTEPDPNQCIFLIYELHSRLDRVLKTLSLSCVALGLWVVALIPAPISAHSLWILPVAPAVATAASSMTPFLSRHLPCVPASHQLLKLSAILALAFRTFDFRTRFHLWLIPTWAFLCSVVIWTAVLLTARAGPQPCRSAS